MCQALKSTSVQSRGSCQKSSRENGCFFVRVKSLVPHLIPQANLPRSSFDPFVWKGEISPKICQFILQCVAPLRGRIQVFLARAAGCWNNEETNQDGFSVCYFVVFSTKLPYLQMERGGFHGASASV